MNNWNNQAGANMIGEQKRGTIAGADFRPEAEPLSNIQEQMGHMENHISFLMNAINTLEREACAKLCEEPGWNAANWCAKQIRARGEKK